MTVSIRDQPDLPDAPTALDLAKAEISVLRQRNAELETLQAQTVSKLALESNVLRTLVETCPFRIYAKDAQSRFIYGNQEVATAMGENSPDDLIGKDDFLFFSHDLAQEYFTDEQTLLASGQAILSKEEPTSDPHSGAIRWLLTTKVPLRDEHQAVVGLVGIDMDMTERKELEQQLRQQNNELTQLNQQLVTTQNQLIQVEKLAALGALVAGVAHELNTPLGNCVLATSTLQEHTLEMSRLLTAGMTKSKLTTYIENAMGALALIEKNLRRSASLVSSFKQIAVDQTTENRRVFKLCDVVAEISLAMTPTLQKARVQMSAQIDPGIALDNYPGPLGQILINLITNAVIHGLDGRTDGHIAIAAEMRQSQLLLTVQDNGVGIAPSNLDRVFDPFFTTKFGLGGSGLGLHISHNIATGLLGGNLSVASRVGEGACFTLSMPVSAPIKPPAI